MRRLTVLLFLVSIAPWIGTAATSSRAKSAAASREPLAAPSPSSLGAPQRPSPMSFSSLRMRRIRHGVAVLETARGGLLLARVGTNLGARNDRVVSIEPDRILLRGVRVADGQRLDSYVELTWDDSGAIHETRAESAPLMGAVRARSRPAASRSH